MRGSYKKKSRVAGPGRIQHPTRAARARHPGPLSVLIPPLRGSLTLKLRGADAGNCAKETFSSLMTSNECHNLAPACIMFGLIVHASDLKMRPC